MKQAVYLLIFHCVFTCVGCRSLTVGNNLNLCSKSVVTDKEYMNDHYVISLDKSWGQVEALTGGGFYLSGADKVSKKQFYFKECNITLENNIDTSGVKSSKHSDFFSGVKEVDSVKVSWYLSTSKTDGLLTYFYPLKDKVAKIKVDFVSYYQGTKDLCRFNSIIENFKSKEVWEEELKK